VAGRTKGIKWSATACAKARALMVLMAARPAVHFMPPPRLVPRFFNHGKMDHIQYNFTVNGSLTEKQLSNKKSVKVCCFVGSLVSRILYTTRFSGLIIGAP
jgi:hypothetical protein